MNIFRVQTGTCYKTCPTPGFKASREAGNQDAFVFSNTFVQKRLSEKLKEAGDGHVRNNQETKAIYYYEKAIKEKPDYVSPYYNLARIYEKTGKLDQAINTYQNLIQVKPDEVEAQTLIGNCFKEKGDYDTARQMYSKAVEIDPKYDFAARALREIDYRLLSLRDPRQAETIKQQTAEKNLKDALVLVNAHAAPHLTKDLHKIAIIFDETDSLAGHKNIAQYENNSRKIAITNDYIWTAPEITAAYIVHEAVHAKDKDGISSIREEQDAYEESIKFWIAHNNGIKDPELDYAADLYRENPHKLRQKVGETYRSRDASMYEYSPYHTPQVGLGFVSSIKIQALKLKSKVCNMIGLS